MQENCKYGGRTWKRGPFKQEYNINVNFKRIWKVEMVLGNFSYVALRDSWNCSLICRGRTFLLLVPIAGQKRLHESIPESRDSTACWLCWDVLVPSLWKDTWREPGQTSVKCWAAKFKTKLWFCNLRQKSVNREWIGLEVFCSLR